MVDKKTQEEILRGMDEATKQAKADFMTLTEDVKKGAAAWVRKWYLKAGYKRLGRFLVSYAKELEKKEVLTEEEKFQQQCAQLGISGARQGDVVINGNQVTVRSGNVVLQAGAADVTLAGGNVDVSGGYNGIIKVTEGGVVKARNGNFFLGKGGKVNVFTGEVHFQNTEVQSGSIIKIRNEDVAISGKGLSYDGKEIKLFYCVCLVASNPWAALFPGKRIF